ncbi:MAG: FadR/GntR family transcriptional regulator [Spirochaetales bacterium]|nr:FadR/GntR family transcriptional regulator [Spirochaetales bacterium]
MFRIDSQRKSAVDTVVDKVKSLLIEKQLKPGDLIPPEPVLAEQLGVSRGSIREAMKILSSFGIVEIRRGDGTYISNAGNQKIFDPLLFNILVSGADFRELIEVRAMMEKEVVRLIISNASDEELAGLDQCMDEFDLAEKQIPHNREVADKIDLKYHRLMGDITHNRIITSMYNFVIDLFAPTINSDLGYKEHKKMHLAIMARDIPGAVTAVEDHNNAWKKNKDESLHPETPS